MDQVVRSRVQGWDVLRGVAVGLVLLRHAWPSIFGGAGIVGVVMFFTLSGYLITGILWRDLERFGRIRYGHFYRNRAIRLVPSLIVVTVAVGTVAALFNLLDDRGSLVRTAAVAITYTADLPFDHGSAAIEHLWTLATEEQFYLVWPVLLVVAFRLQRVRTMLIVSAGAIYLVLGGGGCACFGSFEESFG
ncbi:acyltransferase [Curtobacterium sp. MCBD17_040]|uniref:acyltransferase family protein n=1 Tax=Curtobacterium sp. MCBD17_040 TaxID=2175674 RepID=UPI000DA9F434|nr:acyltransferase [Curtobacterium sp. MCBD17_040]WIB64145.1 acyltransferase [Curtobacterium sp. MCBD17_040]